MRCTLLDRVASAYLDRDILCLWKISSGLGRLITYPFCSFPLIFTRYQVCFLLDTTVGNGKAVLPKSLNFEDTSQTYLSSTSLYMGPFFYFILWKFPKIQKKWISGGDLGQNVLENLSNRSWILKRRDFACSTHFVRRNQRQHREI